MSEKTRQITSHLGSIFFKLSVLFLLFNISLLVSKTIEILMYVFLFFAILFIVFGTLGISLISEKIRYFVSHALELVEGTGINDIITKMLNIYPFISVITGTLFALSIICFAFNLKDHKYLNYFIISIILSIIFIVVLTMNLSMR